MSDLSATNCGGGCGCQENNGFSCWWIIILLIFCGGCGNGRGMMGRDNDCSCIIWILLILCCCGNNEGGGFLGGCC